MIEINRELALFPDALIVCSFRCALPQYALTMALIYAPQLISDRTTKDFKRFYDFDIFQSKLISLGKPLLPLDFLIEETLACNTIFIVSPKVYPQLSKLILDLIYHNDVQSLYRIKKNGCD